MKIEQYISQLLYRYQCVTVPGFGAFLTEIQSAKIDEATHSFFPPKKLISFNPNLKSNDGLLANHLAQAEKVNYEVAVNVIQNEVNNWKEKLQEIGKLTIKNIGGFTLNFEKNLVFTPTDQTNYLKESFGLSNYISPSIVREIPIETKREVYKEQVEVIEDKTPIVITPEKRSTNWLKYAAIAIVSSGLIGFGGYKFYQNYQNRIAQETLIVETNVQKQVSEKIQQATFFINNPLPTVTLTVPNEDMPYHVVGGAFSVEANANKFYLHLLNSGYKARRIPQNKYGLYPVLYGSYPSYSQAFEAMKEIQRNENSKAWLLIQEL